MEEENFYERIERIRGNIEGYELKVKPRVEFLSALLGVFEEKIYNNPALAIRARNVRLFDEKLTSTLSIQIGVGTHIRASDSSLHGEIGYYYTEHIWEDSKGATHECEKKLFCELLVIHGKEVELIKWLSEILEGIEGFRAIVIEGLKTYIETIYPVERIRLGRTIYCKRDFKGENRRIPTRIEIETEPPTERATSAVKMK